MSNHRRRAVPIAPRPGRSSEEAVQSWTIPSVAQNINIPPKDFSTNVLRAIEVLQTSHTTLLGQVTVLQGAVQELQTSHKRLLRQVTVLQSAVEELQTPSTSDRPSRGCSACEGNGRGSRCRYSRTIFIQRVFIAARYSLRKYRFSQGSTKYSSRVLSSLRFPLSWKLSQADFDKIEAFGLHTFRLSSNGISFFTPR